MRGGGRGREVFFPLFRGRNAYICPTLTYHKGTILTIYMHHLHRAIYFIELLHFTRVVYPNDTLTEGIHIFNSLSSHLVFNLFVGLRLAIL